MESPARGPQPCRWGRVWSADAAVPPLGSRVPRVARRAAVPGEHRGNCALTSLGHTARPPDGRAFEVIGCHKAFQRNGTGSLARVETLPWYGAARPSLGAW